MSALTSSTFNFSLLLSLFFSTMNKFVEKYSTSAFQMPLDNGILDMHGKYDAAQDLAYPTFDIPDVHNVSYFSCRFYFSVKS